MTIHIEISNSITCVSCYKLFYAIFFFTRVNFLFIAMEPRLINLSNFLDFLKHISESLKQDFQLYFQIVNKNASEKEIQSGFLSYSK